MAAALLCASPFSLACTPIPGSRQASIPYKAKSAEVVILGRAVSNRANGKIVEVIQWLKGSGPRHVLVQGFGDSAACLSDVPLQRVAVLFGKLDRGTGTVFLNYTGIHDAIEGAGAAAAVTQAVGFEPSNPADGPTQPVR